MTAVWPAPIFIDYLKQGGLFDAVVAGASRR